MACDSSTFLEIVDPPQGDEAIFDVIFSPAAKDFLVAVISRFDFAAEELSRRRQLSHLSMDMTASCPTFDGDSNCDSGESLPPNWNIRPLPPRLRRRHIDLGDVSPADTPRLVNCLNSTADGVQVDFDDGHCPTWHNQLVGWHNILLAATGRLPGVAAQPDDPRQPVMMLRPRAWNMVENRVLVGGRPAPGPLVDFALLMFHISRPLMEAAAGPYFYLSKLEGRSEARLWREIFLYVEGHLGLPLGSVRACVLIENVLASFQLDGILWELRDHSAGLNCGLWDYAASIISRFGHRPEFLLPDRKKYVCMERPFLDAYLRLVVAAATARGAPATGGMAAVVLAEEAAARDQQVAVVVAAKRREIEAGVGGFLVYDLGLVEPARQLWADYGEHAATAAVPPVAITAEDLLTLPKGGVTLAGLTYNVGVGVGFIQAWLDGHGTFIYHSAVEDSATAEISRSQVWQWIRHGARLEESNERVTRVLVTQVVDKVVAEEGREVVAGQLFLELVTKRDFPAFITTYLSECHTFQARHL